jgi:NADH-quinone oxidoreductase E subunit
MDKIDSLLENYPNLSREALIPILQEIQDEYGYLSEDAIRKIGTALKLPSSKIYGLSTFYNQFRFTPKGKYHIQVCHGTGCHMEGAGHILSEITKILNIQDGETSRDEILSLEVLSCVGACAQSPVITVNGEYFEKITKEKLKEIIEYYRHLEE